MPAMTSLKSQPVIEQTTSRIVIADDHPLFRGALRQAIARILPQAEIVEAGDFAATTAAMNGGDDPDVVLLDLSMPGAQGFSGLLYLRAQHPGVPVVVVSGAGDPGVIRKCMEFGASGFVPKSLSVDAMGEALAAVLAGGTWTPPDVDMSTAPDREAADLARRLTSLTPQQVRVLMMLSEGLLNKQIAYELNVSEATIKAHVSAILQKLGVESRTQAVIVAARMAAAPWTTGAPA